MNLIFLHLFLNKSKILTRNLVLFLHYRKLNIIQNNLTKVLTSNVHARLALSRLEMVEQLILSQGISTEKQRYLVLKLYICVICL